MQLLFFPRTTVTTPTLPALNEAVLHAALTGLTAAPQKSLPPWLFYDDRGSALFEQITQLPEYYLTRTERTLFATHADEIFHLVMSSTDNLQPATCNCPTSSSLALHRSINRTRASTRSECAICP